MRLLTLLAVGSLAFAQRADYDSSRQVKLKGSVTRIEWTHPHTFFFVDVRDANGTIRNWAVESGNLIDLDPKFRDPAKWDFHLLPGSPAIGAGRVVPNGLTDLERSPRIATAPDIGAYQFK